MNVSSIPFTLIAFTYSCFGVCLPLLWPCCVLVLSYISTCFGPSAAFCWPLFPVPSVLLQPCFSPAASLETEYPFFFFFFGGMMGTKEIQQGLIKLFLSLSTLVLYILCWTSRVILYVGSSVSQHVRVLGVTQLQQEPWQQSDLFL